MASLGSALLKGIGALVLAVVILGVVGTLVSIVLSIVATAVAALVSLAILAVVALAVVGLVSLLRDGDDPAVESDRPADRTARGDATDPEDRLRSRYVDGELSEAEFERELDRLLETDGGADGLDGDRSRGRESATDRTRLRDR